MDQKVIQKEIRTINEFESQKPGDQATEIAKEAYEVHMYEPVPDIEDTKGILKKSILESYSKASRKGFKNKNAETLHRT